MAAQLESLDRPNNMQSDDIPRALFPNLGRIVPFCTHM